MADYWYWILFAVIAIASFLASGRLEQQFKEYSKVKLPLTGKEVAEKMLRENGITDVIVVSVKGHLSDHYNPANKTINLSESVYNQANVAAAAVAAHECGHAVQHAKAYAPLKLRSALVPVVSFASRWMTWILLIGMLLVNRSLVPLEVGIGLFALTTLFSFITLPLGIGSARSGSVASIRSKLYLSQP